MQNNPLHSFLLTYWQLTLQPNTKYLRKRYPRYLNIKKKLNYHIIIVIDQHDNLRHVLENIPDSYMVNFANEIAESFGSKEVQTDVLAATQLTTSLMKSLLADQFKCAP